MPDSRALPLAPAALVPPAQGPARRLADAIPVRHRGVAVTDIADRLPGVLVDVLDHFPRTTAELSDRISCTAPQLIGRTPDPRGQLFADLRMPVHRRQPPADDPGDVVQPYLEQRLSFHAP